MSYSYNQRKKAIKESKRYGYIEINGQKKTYKKMSGIWKLVDYVKPITKTKGEM